MSHDSFMHVTWLTHMCAMTHSYVFTNEQTSPRGDGQTLPKLWFFRANYCSRKWRSRGRKGGGWGGRAWWRCYWEFAGNTIETQKSADCESAGLVSLRVDMCFMTHSYVCRDSFICVTWLIHTCVVTHSYVWHDSFVRVSWLIHVCDMTLSYVCRDSFICVTWLIHVC